MDGYGAFKDIGVPFISFLLGLLVQYCYERKKEKGAKLKYIEELIEKLIASESETIYICRFYFNQLQRATMKFCADYKIKADIEIELSDLSISCTSGKLNIELATSSSINLINKINNAV